MNRDRLEIVNHNVCSKPFEFIHVWGDYMIWWLPYRESQLNLLLVGGWCATKPGDDFSYASLCGLDKPPFKYVHGMDLTQGTIRPITTMVLSTESELQMAASKAKQSLKDFISRL